MPVLVSPPCPLSGDGGIGAGKGDGAGGSGLELGQGEVLFHGLGLLPTGDGGTDGAGDEKDAGEGLAVWWPGAGGLGGATASGEGLGFARGGSGEDALAVGSDGDKDGGT